MILKCFDKGIQYYCSPISIIVNSPNESVTLVFWVRKIWLLRQTKAKHACFHPENCLRALGAHDNQYITETVTRSLINYTKTIIHLRLSEYR